MRRFALSVLQAVMGDQVNKESLCLKRVFEQGDRFHLGTQPLIGFDPCLGGRKGLTYGPTIVFCTV